MKKSLEELKRLSTICRGDILKMTTLAKSGHPGGSMSSLELLLATYNFANIDPKDPFNPNRDRVVVSHGHISPGVYSVLARLGFFNIEDVIVGFRHPGSIFEGHITRGIPGVEWTTGNLGQGLSAGVGMALASKITKRNYNVFVVMSDGESAKGQVMEARRTAKKYGLNNLVVLVDYNDIQISGRARDVMFVDIKAEYLAAGWKVIEVDGHDLDQITAALEEAVNYKTGPVVIIAKTIIGKGVSFMENRHEFHGKPLSEEQLEKALKELGLENDLQKYKEKRKNLPEKREKYEYPQDFVKVEVEDYILYTREKDVDNRSAFGNALADIASNIKDKYPIVAIDCDLKTSVKLEKFEKVHPQGYIQIGVQEHNAATIAGALSVSGVLTFFADFGVFGLDETFNQQRLNDINHTNLKTVVTHVGINVGEDGKTHHETNYIGVVRNLYNTKIIIPADPNQTDRVIRWVAANEGNYVVAMGRSKIPVILNENGEIFFGKDYKFEYGKIDILRKGEKVTIFTYGNTAHMAVNVADRLKDEGINITVLNVSCPLDVDLNQVRDLIENTHLIVYEDHNKNSGLVPEITKELVVKGIKIKSLTSMGLTDYALSGNYKLLYKIYGLDEDSLYERVKNILNEKV